MMLNIVNFLDIFEGYKETIIYDTINLLSWINSLVYDSLLLSWMIRQDFSMWRVEFICSEAKK